MSTYFLTFSNTSFMNTERIRRQAEDFGKFDFIFCKNESDISEFYKKHKNFMDSRPGFGLWIWKPKIIYDLLLNLEDDDILVYTDAGTFINKNASQRFDYYVSKLIKNKFICAFSTNDSYKAQYFVKNDAIMEYCPDFNENLTNLFYAGLMIIRKSEISVKMINEWLNLCENYDFLDRTKSKKYVEMSYFRGNDADNGLFNLVLFKFRDWVESIYPDEVNLYSGEYQIAHVTNDLENIDWSELDEIPFQLRRITKKFYKNQ